MVIQDGSQTINLQFSDVKVAQFPARLFERENLGGPKSTGPRK